MQDIYYPEMDQFSLILNKQFMVLHLYQKVSPHRRLPIFYKNKVHFVDTLSQRTYFWDTAVPCGSKNSRNVLQLNPDEDKY